MPDTNDVEYPGRGGTVDIRRRLGELEEDVKAIEGSGGTGVIPDPGDLTLIFDNRLV